LAEEAETDDSESELADSDGDDIEPMSDGSQHDDSDDDDNEKIISGLTEGLADDKATPTAFHAGRQLLTTIHSCTTFIFTMHVNSSCAKYFFYFLPSVGSISTVNNELSM